MDSPNPTPSFLLATKKSQRERKQFTRHQRAELERVFHVNRYPNRATRETLARRLCLTIDVILIWFKNKRVADVRSRKPKQPAPTTAGLYETAVQMLYVQTPLYICTRLNIFCYP